MISRLALLPLIVVLLGMTAVLMMLPAAHAAVIRDLETARAFFYSSLVLMMLTIMLAMATVTYVPRNAARSHLATLVGAYLLLPVAMALPVLQAVPDTSALNAWFEMLSSFTTTGATGYEAARLPPSVHLWRASVGWFGGFFILLAAYAVLAPLNLGGAEVISGRVPGRGAVGAMQITRIAEPAQRYTRYALTLFPAFCGLTGMLWVTLLIAGEDSLLALTHAMGTLSTSGISSGEGMVSSTAGLAGEMLVFLFLIFAITRRAFPSTLMEHDPRHLLQDPELRLALLLLLLVPFVLLFSHSLAAIAATGDTEIGLTASLWGALFTAASFLTTTGYESAFWVSANLWAGLEAPGMLLMALSIVGGGVATTAGGVKLLRIYALIRHGERELERIVHPSSVGGQGSEARRLRREGAYMAWIFFMLFAMSIALTMLGLVMTGESFDHALVLTIACLTSTGPIADIALAEPVLFGPLTAPQKFILGVAMLVGRLETLALVALFAPGGWRR